jgi:hypothetical protein
MKYCIVTSYCDNVFFFILLRDGNSKCRHARRFLKHISGRFRIHHTQEAALLHNERSTNKKRKQSRTYKPTQHTNRVIQEELPPLTELFLTTF